MQQWPALCWIQGWRGLDGVVRNVFASDMPIEKGTQQWQLHHRWLLGSAA